MNRQQHDNNTLESHCRTVEESIAKKITTKDATGNGKLDTGELIKGTNVGMLSSSQRLTNNLTETFQEFHGLTPSPFTGRTGITCSQRKSVITGLSTANVNTPQVVSCEQDCSPSTSSCADNHINVHSESNAPLQSDFPVSSVVNLKSVKDKNLCKTDLLCARPHLQHEKSSEIYGAVGDGPISIIGSWALQNLSDNMHPRRDSEVPNDLRENQSFMAKCVEADQSANKNMKQDQFKDSTGTRTGSGRQWHFQASAGTLLQIRASHLVKLTCMLVLVIAVFSFVFHSRIRALEEEKKALLGELGAVKMHVQLLVQRMDDVVALAIPPRSQQRRPDTYEIGEQRGNKVGPGRNLDASNAAEFSSEFIDDVRQPSKKVVKRSAAASRTTKELLYPSDSDGINALNNETTRYGSKMDDWTVSELERANSKASKGNRSNLKTFSRQNGRRHLLRKELRKIRTANRLKIKVLKQKLKQAQQQIFTANACCNDTSPKSLSSAQTASGLTKSRAVYLQIDGSSININKPRQLIGPWYLPEKGNDIGFNDMWYDGLTLDYNGTSIIFQEGGLYLISAQVFYQLQHRHNTKPIPMGYRVHLKKNGNNENHEFRRPLTIAECVPSFPSTVYQTCFTQVAWFVEAQDEMYLEHFTDSLPMIEALRSGQTFLGLVRLN